MSSNRVSYALHFKSGCKLYVDIEFLPFALLEKESDSFAFAHYFMEKWIHRVLLLSKNKYVFFLKQFLKGLKGARLLKQ